LAPTTRQGILQAMYKDLREFIAQVDSAGALRRISGADPRFEIGGITEVAAGSAACPALLFDDIVGFPGGFPGLHQLHHEPAAGGAALGIDPDLRPGHGLK
jgi:3-polyprenyl-4-hydroxybenzoate decarboxylase